MEEIVLKIDQEKADEAHYIFAGVFATMMHDCGMSEKTVAKEIERMYFAARKVLEAVHEKGTGSCDAEKGQMMNNIGTLMIALSWIADELGAPIIDTNKKIYVIQQDRRHESK